MACSNFPPGRHRPLLVLNILLFGQLVFVFRLKHLVAGSKVRSAYLLAIESEHENRTNGIASSKNAQTGKESVIERSLTSSATIMLRVFWDSTTPNEIGRLFLRFHFIFSSFFLQKRWFGLTVRVRVFVCIMRSCCLSIKGKPEQQFNRHSFRLQANHDHFDDYFVAGDCCRFVAEARTRSTGRRTELSRGERERMSRVGPARSVGRRSN